jgi:hypothetical protein
VWGLVLLILLIINELYLYNYCYKDIELYIFYTDYTIFANIMKIAKHISFFYIESRIQYLNTIIGEANKYLYETDIFIHTNFAGFNIDGLLLYTNGRLTAIYHDLTGINPFLLTWGCRDLLKSQKNDYDIFMYIEDDILVPNRAIKYWLEYNKPLIRENYNLGFVRIEVDENGMEYITDTQYGSHLTETVVINGQRFCINDKFPYCAFWIYNKDEFHRFIESGYYDIQQCVLPEFSRLAREYSAWGLHHLSYQNYKSTVIPFFPDSENSENNKPVKPLKIPPLRSTFLNDTPTECVILNVQRYKLTDCCKIYHLPNNYINSWYYCKIRFDDVFQ